MTKEGWEVTTHHGLSETQLLDYQGYVPPSVATARLKLAELAEPSHFERSQADELAHDQIWLAVAHELDKPS